MGIFSFLFKKKSERTEKQVEITPAKHKLIYGKVFIQRREYENAFSFLDEAINLGETEAYLHRGLCHMSLGYNLEAIEDFSNAMIVMPNDCNLFFSRATCYVNISNYKLALEDGKKAIAIADKNFLENRKYNNEAKSQGFDSVNALYNSFMCVWESMKGEPESNKKREQWYNEKKASSQPEDIEYIKEQEKMQANLMKRRQPL